MKHSYVNMTGEALERSCKKTIKWCNEQLHQLELDRDKELVTAEMNRRNWRRKLVFMKPLTYVEVYKDLDKLSRWHIDGFGEDHFFKTIPYQMYRMVAERLLPLCRIDGELSLQVSVSAEDKRHLL